MLLDEALVLSRDLGMRPLMEKVLARRNILEAQREGEGVRKLSSPVPDAERAMRGNSEEVLVGGEHREMVADA